MLFRSGAGAGGPGRPPVLVAAGTDYCAAHRGQFPTVGLRAAGTGTGPTDDATYRPGVVGVFAVSHGCSRVVVDRDQRLRLAVRLRRGAVAGAAQTPVVRRH